MESSADDQRQLHARDILPDASPRAVTEWVETQSLSWCEVLFEPAVWFEILHIVAPDCRVVVDGVAGYG